MRGRINWNPIGVWPRETGVPEEACRFRVPAIKILRGTTCNAWSAEKERNRVAADRVTGPRFFQHLRFLGGDLDFVKKCRTARLRHLIRKHDRERNAQSKDSWLLERILPWWQMSRQIPSASFIRIFIRNLLTCLFCVDLWKCFCVLRFRGLYFWRIRIFLNEDR